MRVGGRQYLAAVEQFATVRAANLRRLRVARGWVQVELARRIGSSESQVCQMETGRRSISLSTIDRLALAMKVPPALVLAELDTPVAVEVAA